MNAHYLDTLIRLRTQMRNEMAKAISTAELLHDTTDCAFLENYDKQMTNDVGNLVRRLHDIRSTVDAEIAALEVKREQFRHDEERIA